MPKNITAKTARYIKLGTKGAWEDECLQKGVLRLGFDEAPHEAALKGDKKAVAQVFLDKGMAQQAPRRGSRCENPFSVETGFGKADLSSDTPRF